MKRLHRSKKQKKKKKKNKKNLQLYFSEPYFDNCITGYGMTSIAIYKRECNIRMIVDLEYVVDNKGFQSLKNPAW